MSLPRALVVVPLAVLLLGGCGEDPAAPRAGVTVEELTGDVSGDVDLQTAAVGGRISLRGTVVAVLSPRAFEVRGVDADQPAPLLVLHGGGEALEVGQDVQVAGTVRLLTDDALADEHGLGRASSVPRHDGRKVVVAYTVDDDLPLDDQ